MHKSILQVVDLCSRLSQARELLSSCVSDEQMAMLSIFDPLIATQEKLFGGDVSINYEWNSHRIIDQRDCFLTCEQEKLQRAVWARMGDDAPVSANFKPILPSRENQWDLKPKHRGLVIDADIDTCESDKGGFAVVLCDDDEIRIYTITAPSFRPGLLEVRELRRDNPGKKW